MNRLPGIGARRRCPELAVAALCLALLVLPLAQAEAQPLGGEEVATLITGNALKGSFGAQVLIMYFDPSGKVVATLRNSPDSGEWWIKGDAYCHKFVRLFDGMERCYEWHPPKSDGERYVL